MDRLQKKCFVASVGFHLALAAILLFAPAFVGPQPDDEDSAPILEFLPDDFTTVEEDVIGGGSPTATPPPAATTPTPLLPTPPPAPAPVSPPTPRESTPTPAPPIPQPEVAPPEPNPEPVKPALTPPPEPEPKLPAEKPKPKPKPAPPKSTDTPKPETPKKPEVKVSLKPLKRYPADTTAAREKAAEQARANAQAQAAAKAVRERQAAVQGSINRLASRLSGSTEVGIPGPGGQAYIGIRSIIQKVYFDAWITPQDVADETAAVVAQVTIARDGSVVARETHITRRSGVASLDRSVEQALDRVRFVAPLPESTQEAQRTFTIKFNLKAKRLFG